MHVPKVPVEIDEPLLKPYRNVDPSVHIGCVPNCVFVVCVQVAVTYWFPVGWEQFVHEPAAPVALDEPVTEPARYVDPSVHDVLVVFVPNCVFDVGVHVAVTYCVPVG